MMKYEKNIIFLKFMTISMPEYTAYPALGSEVFGEDID